MLPGTATLGGAPFNVVAHLSRFGWATSYLSAVGRDELGDRAVARATELGVGTHGIERVTIPTAVALVHLGPNGEATYEFTSPAAHEAFIGQALASVGDPELVVFGTLAQRFAGIRRATEQLCAATERTRLYDVNLRIGAWDRRLVHQLAGLASVVKLNAEEQRVLSGELHLPAASEAFARALAARYDLEAVCITRGATGAALLVGDRYEEGGGNAITPAAFGDADPVGAGDAFAAALAHGLRAGWPPDVILSVANRLGSFVASRPGAIPAWAREDIGLDGLIG